MKNLSLLLSFFSASASGGDWTMGDTIAQSAVVTFQMLDWAQTRYFIKNPHHDCEGKPVTCISGHETNPILGEHPSVGKVNTLNLAGIIIHGAIAYSLPHGPLRDGWQYVWIGIEANAVHSNYSAGVKLAF